MSCGRIALEKLGVTVDKYYASEIDVPAISISKKNYPDIVHVGDVTQLTEDFLFSLDKIDLLIGGSPCQDLSIAKTNRKGLSGERSKLFWEYIRILETVKPRYFFFENVGSMKNSDKEVITEVFGYEPIEINSGLMSAQNRVRYYWTNIPNVTIPEDRGIVVKDILLDEKVIDPKFYLQEDYTYYPSSNKKSRTGMKFVCGIVSSKKWLDNGKDLSRNFPQGNRVYSINGKSSSLNANGGGLGAKTGLYYLEDGQPFQKSNIRRLTPLECERLQTVPDNYTEGVADSQRYKMLGNGWTVDVIAHIFKGLQK